MSTSDPCNCTQSLAMALELRAWRFIAAHRIGTSRASVVQFLDDDCRYKRIATPRGNGQVNATAIAPTFEQAIVSLAYSLGMPADNPPAQSVPTIDTHETAAQYVERLRERVLSDAREFERHRDAAGDDVRRTAAKWLGSYR